MLSLNAISDLKALEAKAMASSPEQKKFWAKAFGLKSVDEFKAKKAAIMALPAAKQEAAAKAIVDKVKKIKANMSLEEELLSMDWKSELEAYYEKAKALPEAKKAMYLKKAGLKSVEEFRAKKAAFMKLSVAEQEKKAKVLLAKIKAAMSLEEDDLLAMDWKSELEAYYEKAKALPEAKKAMYLKKAGLKSVEEFRAKKAAFMKLSAAEQEKKAKVLLAKIKAAMSLEEDDLMSMDWKDDLKAMMAKAKALPAEKKAFYLKKLGYKSEADFKAKQAAFMKLSLAEQEKKGKALLAKIKAVMSLEEDDLLSMDWKSDLETYYAKAKALPEDKKAFYLKKAGLKSVDEFKAKKAAFMKLAPAAQEAKGKAMVAKIKAALAAKQQLLDLDEEEAEEFYLY